ncbi:hypothetical protein COCNU_14G007540 [Cocos nucifera]|uniref:Uncharacterized protein n=1 Tax=Cocos nucifera TaxID=13894 RepID=A0A8K0IVF5_COCNU|nr:hypothetical protein COCNU_14G007540 [Cocos nucifera]
MVDQGEKDILRIYDSLVDVPESRTEPVNLLVKVTTVPTDLRIELMVEMTLPTSPIEVLVKVTTTKMEETRGMSSPEVSEGFTKVAEAIHAAHRRNEILEKRRSEAERDCLRARNNIDCLRRMLKGRGGSASETHSSRDSTRRSKKRSRASDKRHPIERVSRRSDSPVAHGTLVIHEPSTETELRKANEQFDQLYQNRTNVVIKACRLEFFTGFERCKEMVQAHLPSEDLVHIESLWADSPDNNLRIVIRNYLDKLANSSGMPVIINRDLSILERGQRSPIECLFSEAILSLPAPDISNLFLEEELVDVARTPNALIVKAQPTMTTGPSGTVPTGVGLHDSILKDYGLACKMMHNMLYIKDALADCNHVNESFKDRLQKEEDWKLIKAASEEARATALRAEAATSRVEASLKKAEED